MATSYVMKVARNGQVSIPAETRARWTADRVAIVDLGDRVVLRPLPTDPVGDIRGKYRGRGTTTRAREQDRADEPDRAKRHR